MVNRMMLRIQEQHPTAWGYGTESLLTILIWILIERLWGPSRVAHFLFVRKQDIQFTIGLLAAVCGLVFAAYIALLCTEFGKKLRKAEAAVEYLVAFLTPFAAFSVTICGLHFLSNDFPGKSAAFTLFLLIYCLLNCYSMPKNLVGLVTIWQDLDKLKR